MRERYVFVSHNSKDRVIVDRLLDFLKQNHISYWIAPEHIEAGSNYAREIPKAIRECGLFLLLISEKSQHSIWVEKELDSAICNKKIVLPVIIDNHPMEEMFQFYLNNVQAIDASKGINPVLDIILRRIVESLEQGNANTDQNFANGKNATKTKTCNAKEVSDGTTASEEATKGIRNATPLVRAALEKSNALRINRIPVICEQCGGELRQISLGIYHCVECGKEHFDDYQTVRNYLEKAGPATAMEIAKATGVGLKTIDYFFKQEYLEIAQNSKMLLHCKSCSAPIRTGELCDNCKKRMGTKNKSLKGKMHTKLWRE